MSVNLKELNEFLSEKANLLQDNFQYHKLHYKEICKLVSNKALVYAFGNTPIAEVYDNTGEISTRVAFLDGRWKENLPEEMDFGGETIRISVEEFLQLYNQAKRTTPLPKRAKPVVKSGAKAAAVKGTAATHKPKTRKNLPITVIKK